MKNGVFASLLAVFSCIGGIVNAIDLNDKFYAKVGAKIGYNAVFYQGEVADAIKQAKDGNISTKSVAHGLNASVVADVFYKATDVIHPFVGVDLNGNYNFDNEFVKDSKFNQYFNFNFKLGASFKVNKDLKINPYGLVGFNVSEYKTGDTYVKEENIRYKTYGFVIDNMYREAIKFKEQFNDGSLPDAYAREPARFNINTNSFENGGLFYNFVNFNAYDILGYHYTFGGGKSFYDVEIEKIDTQEEMDIFSKQTGIDFKNGSYSYGRTALDEETCLWMKNSGYKTAEIEYGGEKYYFFIVDNRNVITIDGFNGGKKLQIFFPSADFLKQSEIDEMKQLAEMMRKGELDDEAKQRYEELSGTWKQILKNLGYKEEDFFTTIIEKGKNKHKVGLNAGFGVDFVIKDRYIAGVEYRYSEVKFDALKVQTHNVGVKFGYYFL